MFFSLSSLSYLVVLSGSVLLLVGTRASPLASSPCCAPGRPEALRRSRCSFLLLRLPRLAAVVALPLGWDFGAPLNTYASFSLAGSSFVAQLPLLRSGSSSVKLLNLLLLLEPPLLLALHLLSHLCGPLLVPCRVCTAFDSTHTVTGPVHWRAVVRRRSGGRLPVDEAETRRAKVVDAPNLGVAVAVDASVSDLAALFPCAYYQRLPRRR